jgi:hypothetical protein
MTSGSISQDAAADKMKPTDAELERKEKPTYPPKYPLPRLVRYDSWGGVFHVYKINRSPRDVIRRLKEAAIEGTSRRLGYFQDTGLDGTSENDLNEISDRILFVAMDLHVGYSTTTFGCLDVKDKFNMPAHCWVQLGRVGEMLENMINEKTLIRWDNLSKENSFIADLHFMYYIMVKDWDHDQRRQWEAKFPPRESED